MGTRKIYPFGSRRKAKAGKTSDAPLPSAYGFPGAGPRAGASGTDAAASVPMTREKAHFILGELMAKLNGGIAPGSEQLDAAARAAWPFIKIFDDAQRDVRSVRLETLQEKVFFVGVYGAAKGSAIRSVIRCLAGETEGTTVCH